MADFQLQLDVLAQTVKLEQGLKKAEAEVSKSAKKMDAELDKIDAGESAGARIGEEFKSSLFGAVGAGAIAVGLNTALQKAAESMIPGAREDGMGVGYAFAEGLAEGLATVPIVGAVGQIIGNLFGAGEFERVQNERQKAAEQVAAAERRRLKILKGQNELIEQAKKLEEERAKIIERQRQESLSATEEYQAKQREIFDREMEIRERGNEDELRRLKHINELTDLQDEYNKKIEEATKDHNRELAKQLSIQRDALVYRLNQLQALENQAAAEERAATIAERRLQAEREIAEARAEAERQVAGATATFATAGGSFTAGVSAQVNEAKLLTKISQQSRDFLAQIVQNTMSLPGVLSLG